MWQAQDLYLKIHGDALILRMGARIHRQYVDLFVALRLRDVSQQSLAIEGIDMNIASFEFRVGSLPPFLMDGGVPT